MDNTTTETLDELVEAIMDIAREQSHSDAEIFIRDRVEKYVREIQCTNTVSGTTLPATPE